MRTNAISTKIKFIGILFILLMTSIIATTIYLNEKNKKDALLINIAGKQRMLTQKISKNIFYHYYNHSATYTNLDEATNEFIYNFKTLKDGNEQLGISKAPTKKINRQLEKIEKLWNDFYSNITAFKKITYEKNFDKIKVKSIIDNIYKTNPILLEEVDKAVSMFTVYAEQKTKTIKYIQYLFAIIILLLMFYSFSELKKMEENVKKFFEYSKEATVNIENVVNLKPIQIEAEKEIVDATDTINYFIQKVNSAMNYSTDAIEQSKNASVRLEEITDDFDKIIDNLSHSKEVSKHLDKSEDMVIQTQEELINSSKKLQELKTELDKLLNSLKT